MAKKQWVNLELGDIAKGEGRECLLKLNASETKPKASDDQEVYFFIEPDKGKNVDAKFLKASARAIGFHSKPPHRIPVKFKDKKAEVIAALSVSGGDQFSFKYGKKDDGSDAQKYPGDPIETWRKIMVRYGHMKGCKLGKPTGLNGKLAKLFIELEYDGGPVKIPHRAVVTDPSDPVSLMDKAVAGLKHAAQTVKIVYVDRIMDEGQKELDLTYDRSAIPGKKFVVQQTELKLTWPFDDWLIGGKIVLFDGKGDVRADQPIHSYVTRAKSGIYFKHAEGLATDSLEFNLKKYPGIDDWMKEKGGKMVIFAQFKTIQSGAGGMANALSPDVMVATRSCFTYKKATTMSGTLLHELGHIIGNVLRWIYTYDPQTGADDDETQNMHWYEAHGGMGNHCKNGSSPKDSTYEAGSGACIMYHAMTDMELDFCDQCQRIIKRAELTKLGRVNVWGDEGWKRPPGETPPA